MNEFKENVERRLAIEASRITSKLSKDDTVRDPKPGLDLGKQIEALLNDKFNNLYAELEQHLAEVKTTVEKGRPREAPTSFTQSTLAAAVGAGSVPALAKAVGDPDERFVADLVRTYNSALDLFESQYTPKSAHVGKPGYPHLSPHDAGSFFVVKAPSGRFYGLPRRRSITPTLHQNVGLPAFFQYTGYDSKVPETSFSLERPANLVADSSSGWSLKEPGQLRLLKAQEN